MMGNYGHALLAFLLGTCICSVRGFMPAPSLARVSHGASKQHRHVLQKSTSLCPTPNKQLQGRSDGALRMGWGDALGKAFANEDMGDKKVQNPGLKKDLKWCMVTVNGRVVKAVQGQRLRDAVGASGAKIEYGCEKGDCGTCESIVDGKKVRVCKAIVPRNKDKLTVKTKFG